MSSTDRSNTAPDGTAEPWVWIDGEVRRPAEARVEVLDRGFLYGDSVYETVRTHTLRGHERRFFALEEHLDRLEESAAAIALPLPWGRAGITAVLDQLLAAAPAGGEVGARLTITRGVGPLGLDPSACHQPRLVGFAWSIPAGRHPLAEAGVACIISRIRRNPPSALDPRIKSGNFLNNILAYQEARARNAFEAILLSVDGHLTECTTSNLFWVTGSEVRTADDEGILLGVTRTHILRLLEQHAIPHRLGSFPPEELRHADEIFITSSLKGVLPVVHLDGTPVGTAQPGPLTRHIQDLYDGVTLNA